MFSHGFGIGDPLANAIDHEVGTAPRTHTRHTKTWGTAPEIPVANQLDVTAIHVASVTIDPLRARVTCDATINVTSDGPLTVTLLGCPSSRHDGHGAITERGAGEEVPRSNRAWVSLHPPMI